MLEILFENQTWGVKATSGFGVMLFSSLELISNISTHKWFSQPDHYIDEKIEHSIHQVMFLEFLQKGTYKN